MKTEEVKITVNVPEVSDFDKEGLIKHLKEVIKEDNLLKDISTEEFIHHLDIWELVEDYTDGICINNKMTQQVFIIYYEDTENSIAKYQYNKIHDALIEFVNKYREEIFN